MPGDSRQELDLVAGDTKPGIQFGVADLSRATSALKALGMDVKTNSPGVLTVTDPDGVVLSFQKADAR